MTHVLRSGRADPWEVLTERMEIMVLSRGRLHLNMTWIMSTGFPPLNNAMRRESELAG